MHLRKRKRYFGAAAVGPAQLIDQHLADIVSGMVPGVVVVAAEGYRACEQALAGSHVHDLDAAPLDKRAHLVHAPENQNLRVLRASGLGHGVLVHVVRRTGRGRAAQFFRREAAAVRQGGGDVGGKEFQPLLMRGTLIARLAGGVGVVEIRNGDADRRRGGRSRDEQHSSGRQ